MLFNLADRPTTHTASLYVVYWAQAQYMPVARRPSYGNDIKEIKGSVGRYGPTRHTWHPRKNHALALGIVALLAVVSSFFNCNSMLGFPMPASLSPPSDLGSVQAREIVLKQGRMIYSETNVLLQP